MTKRKAEEPVDVGLGATLAHMRGEAHDDGGDW